MSFKKEYRLTPEETKAIQRLENLENLNQIKVLEDRVLKILSNLGVDTSAYTEKANKETLELSDAYFKRTILKARQRMMEQKAQI